MCSFQIFLRINKCGERFWHCWIHFVWFLLFQSIWKSIPKNSIDLFALHQSMQIYRVMQKSIMHTDERVRDKNGADVSHEHALVVASTATAIAIATSSQSLMIISLKCRSECVRWVSSVRACVPACLPACLCAIGFLLLRFINYHISLWRYSVCSVVWWALYNRLIWCGKCTELVAIKCWRLSQSSSVHQSHSLGFDSDFSHKSH